MALNFSETSYKIHSVFFELSDLSKFSFMAVMRQKPDYRGLKSEWSREGSKSE